MDTDPRGSNRCPRLIGLAVDGQKTDRDEFSSAVDYIGVRDRRGYYGRKSAPTMRRRFRSGCRNAGAEGARDQLIIVAIHANLLKQASCLSVMSNEHLAMWLTLLTVLIGSAIVSHMDNRSRNPWPTLIAFFIP